MLEKLVELEISAENSRLRKESTCKSKAERTRTRRMNNKDRRLSKGFLAHIVNSTLSTKSRTPTRRRNMHRTSDNRPQQYSSFDRRLYGKTPGKRKDLTNAALALQREEVRNTERQKAKSDSERERHLRRMRKGSSRRQSCRLAWKERRGDFAPLSSSTSSSVLSSTNVQRLMERKRDLLRQYKGILEKEMVCVHGNETRRSSCPPLSTYRSESSDSSSHPRTARSSCSEWSLASIPGPRPPKPEGVSRLDFGRIRAGG